MHRASVCRVLAAAALAVPAGLAVPSAASAAEVTLDLSSVTPAVARAGEDLVVTGTLQNDTGRPLTRPTVSVVMGAMAPTRQAVRDWAAQTGPAQGTVVGQTRLSGSVAAGASQGFSVKVAKVAALGPAAYGAIPLSVQSGTASVRTFAGYQQTKQYQPMAISWAVPLTLDQDPNLFGGRGAAR